MRLLWISGLILAGASAYGDVFNPQIMPIGERQAFMGNTGTGDSSDSGAVFYNPAGLADLGRDKVSVNGSFYLNYRIKYATLASINGASIPYEATGLNTIPSTFVSTLRFWGFNFALSVLVPESVSLENRSAIVATGVDGQLLQSARVADLRVGLSAARKLGDHFGLGLTFSVTHHAESQLFSLIAHYPGTANTVSSTTRSLALSSFGLLATLGAKWSPTDWFSLGARVQPPLIQVAGGANTFASTDVTKAGVVTTSDREDRPDSDANYQLPLDATLGAAFMPVHWFELLADVSFQTGVDYSNVRNSVFTTSVNTDPTFRYNLGMQFTLTPAWSILAGGSYNPSTIHDLDITHRGDSQVDYWGASLGVIWSVDHMQTGLGGVYFVGSGRFRTADDKMDSASFTGLGVLLTTAYVF